MKKIIVAISLFLLSFQPSDIIFIKNKNYVSYFSVSYHIPICVQYSIIPNYFNCVSKVIHHYNFHCNENYKSITNLESLYYKSGFDRGHCMSADDNRCDIIGLKQCYNYENIIPQHHNFNVGKWFDLECHERKLSNQYNIINVSIGVNIQERVNKIHGLAIPANVYKIIYIPFIKKYECYSFLNCDTLKQSLIHYEVDTTYIKHKYNVVFKAGFCYPK
jgi:DNA/RNA endonuclease G (NUC1)